MQSPTHYKLLEKHDARLHVDLELGLSIALLGLILFIRITNIRYNTLFVDEAIYVTGGRDLLANLTDSHIATWYGGSYLYPLLSAAAANLAGVVGIRLISAVLTTITALLVYLTARQLFGRQAALWAMLIFGLAGGSISLGQLAVYDVMLLPFLAAALYCLVRAAQSERSARKYLLSGALAFSLAALAKYTAIFYLPALVLTACALYVIQHRPRQIFQLMIFFLIPVGLILGVYALYFFNDLVQVFTQQGFEAAPRVVVFQSIWDEIGGNPMVLAMLGLVFLVVTARRGSTLDAVPVAGKLRAYLQSKNRLIFLLVIAAAAMLAAAYMALPLYQLLTSNIRSVWKNTVDSQIFLAPLAGYLVAMVIEQIRNRGAARLAGAALLTLLVVSWVSYSLDRNAGFQHSWPDVGGAITYLRGQGLSKDSHVLAEAGAIYEYYFYPDFGIDGRRVWTDTWFMDYQGQQGTDAMKAAIADHFFDFAVLDDNYTADINPQLDTALQQAGYKVNYRDVQTITTGHDSLVRVYTRP